MNTHYTNFSHSPFVFPWQVAQTVTAAVAGVWTALRRSGAPACGRMHQWGKRGSTPWPSQPRAPVCPSTLQQCQTILTTVTGDSQVPPLDGDRELAISVVHSKVPHHFTFTNAYLMHSHFLNEIYQRVLSAELVKASAKYTFTFQLCLHTDYWHEGGRFYFQKKSAWEVVCLANTGNSETVLW